MRRVFVVTIYVCLSITQLLGAYEGPGIQAFESIKKYRNKYTSYKDVILPILGEPAYKRKVDLGDIWGTRWVGWEYRWEGSEGRKHWCLATVVWDRVNTKECDAENVADNKWEYYEWETPVPGYSSTIDRERIWAYYSSHKNKHVKYEDVVSEIGEPDRKVGNLAPGNFWDAVWERFPLLAKENSESQGWRLSVQVNPKGKTERMEFDSFAKPWKTPDVGGYDESSEVVNTKYICKGFTQQIGVLSSIFKYETKTEVKLRYGWSDDGFWVVLPGEWFLAPGTFIYVYEEENEKNQKRRIASLYELECPGKEDTE